MSDEQYTAAYVAELEAENRRLVSELGAAYRQLDNCVSRLCQYADADYLSGTLYESGVWGEPDEFISDVVDTYAAARAGKESE